MTITDQAQGPIDLAERTQTATTSDDTAEAVIGRLVQIFNDGGIAVLTSIGHQLGLFETLATLPPASSQQVADAAGLEERYVREWLGGVVTAGFVTYDPDAQTYSLCPDHAPFLTGNSPDNIARSMPYVTLMGQVLPKVLNAFRNGGGLTYADYAGFHDIQGQETQAALDASLIESIVPFSGARERLIAGIDVADFGCGQGHAVNLLAREFPNSRFTGFDFEAETIQAARAEAARWGLRNASFAIRDIAGAPDPEAYDLLIGFDVIHDQAKPAQVLDNIRASLRPGGTLLLQDIDASSRLEDNLELPWASFLYAISTTHCMAVSLGQGGAGLGTVWGVQLAEQMLRDAGFADIAVHRLEADPFKVYFVAQV